MKSQLYQFFRTIGTKSFLLKGLFTFLFTLGLTCYLYWPLYQKIPLQNSKQDLDQEISRLDLSLSEEIKDILDRKIDLPKDRHELCLKNKNQFHLIHSDTTFIDGSPLIFATNDLVQYDFGKQHDLGAMAIKIYYNNDLPYDENYRNVNDKRDCITLATEKLKNYDHSTIEYKTVGLSLTEELDLGNDETINRERPVAGGHFINTGNSWAYIGARPGYFLLTFVTLLAVIYMLVNWISKYKVLKKVFKSKE